jgi:hypothetical protein
MMSEQDRDRAEQSFTHNHGPMSDYEARALVIREKSERLKALRLAKQAADQKSKRRK